MHAPFAGGRGDAGTLFGLIHGNSNRIQTALFENHFIGYVYDDRDAKGFGARLDTVAYEMR